MELAKACIQDWRPWRKLKVPELDQYSTSREKAMVATGQQMLELNAQRPIGLEVANWQEMQITNDCY